MKQTTRIQLELPAAAMERLLELKEKTEATSYAEVTKHAYRLYRRLIELVESGQTLCIRDQNGKIRDLEIFL